MKLFAPLFLTLMFACYILALIVDAMDHVGFLILDLAIFPIGVIRGVYMAVFIIVHL